MSLESLRRLGSDTAPKAIAELQGLTFSLVTGAAASTPIPIPGIESEDTLKSVLNLTDLVEMDVTHFTVGDRRASGTLTVQGTLANGDTVAVNGKTYTFTAGSESIATNAAPLVVPFNTPVVAATVATRLAQVIMSSDSGVTATAAGAIVTIAWRVPGTVGNGKTLTVTGANGHVTSSGAALAGGAATAGIQSTDTSATKKLLVVWYNKQ